MNYQEVNVLSQIHHLGFVKLATAQIVLGLETQNNYVSLDMKLDYIAFLEDMSLADPLPVIFS